MSGVVHIPWYATGFRAEQLRRELERVSPLALRYGATGYAVHRSQDDKYKLLQMLEFDEHLDWDRWWEGPEMVDFRSYCQGWFQIPVLYVWHTVVCEGREPHRAGVSAGNAQ